jgi:molybdopterin molybdotransferase
MNNKEKTVSLEEAQKIIMNSIIPLGNENVSIFEAFNRFLYKDIISDIIDPPLDNSAMDGYAIIADDTAGASKENPKNLKITGETRAGEFESKHVSRGTAVRIMTGAPMPEGADSVIEFEETEEDGNMVKIYKEVEKEENIRFAGENINKGDIILRKGDRLKSSDVGMLASLNYTKVSVYKRPEIAIISTGDEIVDIGKNIKFGQIRNSNAYTLYSEIKKYNCIPHYIGIAKDNIKDTKNKFHKALKYDVILSIGGVSKGRYDFVKEAYKEFDINIKFEWVRVKPGRPCTFGKKNKKLIFGLPGNQVSTLTSFIQFVRPAILGLMGANRIHKPIVKAILEENIEKKPDRMHLIRAYFSIKNNEFHVSTTGPQGSGILRSMSKANCLIIVPQEVTRIKAGERVSIQLIEHYEI